MGCAAVTEAAPLPGVLAEIAEVAGRDAALELALAHGGEDAFHIPRPDRLDPDHPLIALAGPARAQAIARRFGGETIAVPLARRALVRHLAGQGLGTAAIAARLRISKRTARRYRKTTPNQTT